ncbi:MAG: hypothetical protein M1834_002899 [Cirrosporium novae-zelandiae]|nr:MAG: hypothetical protein M1834_002899 [Cirrosporium novae-zelandiae]
MTQQCQLPTSYGLAEKLICLTYQEIIPCYAIDLPPELGTDKYEWTLLRNKIQSNELIRDLLMRVHSDLRAGSEHQLAHWQFIADLDNYVPLGILRIEGLQNYATIGNMRLRISPLYAHPEGNDIWTELNHKELGTLVDRIKSSPKEGSCISIYTCEALIHLKKANWIRIFYRPHPMSDAMASLRVYFLPTDCGQRFVTDRRNSKFVRYVRHVLEEIDTALESWVGCFNPSSILKPFFSPPAGEQESLFYIFNTLSSPSPSPNNVNSPYATDAMLNCLEDGIAIEGLKTKLYPYQRRSAASMIQRESLPAKSSDPRFEKCVGPSGSTFYFDRQTTIILKHRPTYEDARGGILAETMGYGKTLITLAVILATKGHFPEIPPQYVDESPLPRPKTASLLEMAATCIKAHSIPWRPWFQKLEDQTGTSYSSCIEALEQRVCSYELRITSNDPARRSKRAPMAACQLIKMCSTTIIVVPPSLLVQWQSEIMKHTEGLRVLVMNSLSTNTPPADEISRYDIILFSKNRFDAEFNSGHRNLQYQLLNKASHASPLYSLHFLRIVIDEGHGFASTNTSSVLLMENLHVQSRWIVSGTPSNKMIGAEVGLAAYETNEVAASSSLGVNQVLQNRKISVLDNQEKKELQKLGTLAQNFFKIQPWSNLNSDTASWQKYILPTDATGNRQKAVYLRRVLEGLLVRHTWSDIEKELPLPQLYNNIVYLEPSFYDKLSQNLFVVNLTSNAITSERVDRDYMFHPANRQYLKTLISNLRHSGFWWCAFSEESVQETLRVSRVYLEKQDKVLSQADKQLLINAIAIGEKALSSLGWNAFFQLGEIGVFVDDFPENAKAPWALPGSTNSMLLGTTKAREAQKFVDNQLYALDPFNGLLEQGETVMGNAWRAGPDPKIRDIEGKQNDRVPGVCKVAITEGQVTRNPILDASRRRRLQGAFVPSATTRSKAKAKRSSGGPPVILKGINIPWSPKIQKSALKKSKATNVPQVSPFITKPKIVGTSSAKLSYLIDRVLVLQEEEKIIIFYEDNNIAFWLAEALELVSIKFLIYAGTLTWQLRAEYLETFNKPESEFKVLIMDLGQAAHGLHIASASRIFFVNPVWQSNIEAQAIKRAHRIGQTRPVYVETLVLRDTLEHKMLQRRNVMTAYESEHAKDSLLDDVTMEHVIQEQEFIPFANGDEGMEEQMARLNVPQQLFGRFLGVEETTGRVRKSSNDGRSFGSPKKKRAKVTFPSLSDTQNLDVEVKQFGLPQSPLHRRSNSKAKKLARFQNPSESMELDTQFSPSSFTPSSLQSLSSSTPGQRHTTPESYDLTSQHAQTRDVYMQDGEELPPLSPSSLFGGKPNKPSLPPLAPPNAPSAREMAQRVRSPTAPKGNSYLNEFDGNE